jgi:hypothetical protein
VKVAGKAIAFVQIGEPNGKEIPYLLEVVKETPTTYFTVEAIALGLRDLAPTYRAKRVVRWSKLERRRNGDNTSDPHFKICRTLSRPEADMLRGKVVILTQAKEAA